MIFAILLALSCGSERTQVKDLLDGVKLHNSGQTTVENLIKLPAPRWSNSGPRTDHEFSIVTIDTTVLRYHKEADQDLHLVLKGDSGLTMIAEIPSPECAATSPWAGSMKTAREQFLKIYRPGVRVRLMGVIFFDKIHGQDGVAVQGVELHPVLRIEVLK